MIKNIRNIFGVILMCLAIFSFLYIDVYLLISSVVNIIQGESIIWNVFLICVRSIVGLVVAAGLGFVGILVMTSKKIGSARRK